MSTRQVLPKKKIEELRKEVEKEFPESYGLQQIHLARLIIEEKTKGLTAKERVQYYRDIAKNLRRSPNILERNLKKEAERRYNIMKERNYEI